MFVDGHYQNYGSFFEKSNVGVLGPVKLVAPNGEQMDLSQNWWGYKVGINGIDEKKLYLEKEGRNWHHKLQFNRPLVWYKVTYLYAIILNLSISHTLIYIYM